MDGDVITIDATRRRRESERAPAGRARAPAGRPAESMRARPPGRGRALSPTAGVAGGGDLGRTTDGFRDGGSGGETVVCLVHLEIFTLLRNFQWIFCRCVSCGVVLGVPTLAARRARWVTVLPRVTTLTSPGGPQAQAPTQSPMSSQTRQCLHCMALLGNGRGRRSGVGHGTSRRGDWPRDRGTG